MASVIIDGDFEVNGYKFDPSLREISGIKFPLADPEFLRWDFPFNFEITDMSKFVYIYYEDAIRVLREVGKENVAQYLENCDYLYIQVPPCICRYFADVSVVA